MRVSVNIAFEQLKELIKQLSYSELNELKEELKKVSDKKSMHKGKELKDRLLHGPTLNEENIKKIEAARERINAWRS